MAASTHMQKVQAAPKVYRVRSSQLLLTGMLSKPLKDISKAQSPSPYRLLPRPLAAIIGQGWLGVVSTTIA